uniref:Uncharacterized protein n=1 Tax=Romanomermis culicivorax TaxID=13658 RepID=A0A915IRW7_ROMCU
MDNKKRNMPNEPSLKPKFDSKNMYNFCAFNNDKTVLAVTKDAAHEVSPEKNSSCNSCSSTPGNFGERPTSFSTDENDDYAAFVTNGNFGANNKNGKDLVVVKKKYDNNNTDDCIIEIRNYYRNMAQRLRIKQRSNLLDFEKISSEKIPEIPPLVLPQELAVSENVESPIFKDCSKSTNVESPIKDYSKSTNVESPIPKDCSKSTSLESSSTKDTNSTANSTILSLNDGLLDYSTLKKLLRKQRKLYKKKLDEEKTKREALEEFLIKFNNNNSIDSSKRSSSLNTFNLTSSPQKSKSRKLWHVEKSFSSNNLQIEQEKRPILNKIFVNRRPRDKERKFSDDSTITTTSTDNTQITKLTTNSDGFFVENKQKRELRSNSNANFLPKMVGNSKSTTIKTPFVSYFLPLEKENVENRSLM